MRTPKTFPFLKFGTVSKVLYKEKKIRSVVTVGVWDKVG